MHAPIVSLICPPTRFAGNTPRNPKARIHAPTNHPKRVEPVVMPARATMSPGLARGAKKAPGKRVGKGWSELAVQVTNHARPK